VVFGRGRRVGEPLEGGLITQTVLQDRLALIGQDCECDLDRSSLQGPVIPARWDSSRQRAAATALGFDPENPLIRAEISRIVLKGPARPASSRAAPNAFDALSLGYSEDPVSAPDSTSASADAEPATDSDPTDVRAGGTRPTSAASTPPPPTTAAAAVLQRGTLASWFALSGLSLVVAVAGTWLLVRARKNRS
ncbi:MAG: hypothetical protein IT580_15255, partial [Verrucomicrobiales bacterium]|nr:hypothetical protein [Verrucomicrobiales bacterium]